MWTVTDIAVEGLPVVYTKLTDAELLSYCNRRKTEHIQMAMKWPAGLKLVVPSYWNPAQGQVDILKLYQNGTLLQHLQATRDDMVE